MLGKRKREKTQKTLEKIRQLTSIDENLESVNGDENVWLERFDHPLLNDVILDTLFAYVKPNDLKACRLVSKKWTIRSLTSARATFHATIRSDNTIWNPAPVNYGITDFIKVFSSSSGSLGFPFAKLKLGSFDSTVGPGKELIKICGEMTKKIDLHTGNFHYLENISALLKSLPTLEYFKMPSTLFSWEAMYQKVILKQPPAEYNFKLFSESEVPSLKCLKVLEVEQDHAELRLKACPTFLEELLSAAENISTIFIANPSYRTSGTVLELLKVIEKLGRESKLQILSLPNMKSEHLEVLQRMITKKGGLKLKHLSVKYEVWGQQHLWFQLVDWMKDSLVSLQVHQSFTIPNNFPRMSKLKVLDLAFYGIFNDSPLNDFSNSFPVLQSLRLSIPLREESERLALDEFYVDSLDSCPIMESLTLENFLVNIRAFERTLKVFPNLKELEMNISVDGADILQKIWTQMTGLVKLKIYGRLKHGNNVESLVTGISADGIKEIRQTKLKRLKDMRMEERKETISALNNKLRALPSIAGLTNLKYLTLNMTTNGEKYKTHLSDLTGYFGFYLMRNLRQLNISNCELSKPCSEILVADMGLESWKFQSPGELEIIPSRWDSDNDFDWNKFPSSKL